MLRYSYNSRFNLKNLPSCKSFRDLNPYIFAFSIFFLLLATNTMFNSAGELPPDPVKGTCESNGCHTGAKWATLILDTPSEVPKEYEFEFKLIVKNSWTNEKYTIQDVTASIDLSKSPNIVLGEGESATKNGPSEIKSGSSYTFKWKLKSRAQSNNTVSVSVSFYACYDHTDPQYPDKGFYTYTKSCNIKVGSTLVKNSILYTPPPVILISIGVLFAVGTVIFWDGGVLYGLGKRLVTNDAKRKFAKKVSSILSASIAFVYLLVILYLASSGRLPISLSFSGFVLVITVLCVGLLGLGKINLGEISRPLSYWLCLIASLFVFEHWSVFGLQYNAITLQWITGRFVGWVSFILLILSIFTGGLIKPVTQSLNKSLGCAANRVSIHCFISIMIVGLSIFHALLLMLGWYLGRTTGLLSGIIALISFSLLGITGTFQVSICKKIGHSTWRTIHFWLTLLSTIIVIQHALVNGTSFAFLRY